MLTHRTVHVTVCLTKTEIHVTTPKVVQCRLDKQWVPSSGEAKIAEKEMKKSEVKISTEMFLPKGTTGAELMNSKAFTGSFSAGFAKALDTDPAAVRVKGISTTGGATTTESEDAADSEDSFFQFQESHQV